jgi:AhpD family alkylhydroperoxidase
VPRLRYIEESEKTPHARELIESAKRTGAPDPRVVSLMTRSPLGIAWVEYWNKLLYQGVLPHKLKEMCRIKISVAHQCGYCSTVRSNVAKVEGLTEDMINDLVDYSGSARFSAREKAALHYADLFKQGEHAIDKDQVYGDLAKHFSDEEIIELGLFCAEVDGVGKFVKSLNVLSWEEACELNPKDQVDGRIRPCCLHDSDLRNGKPRVACPHDSAGDGGRAGKVARRETCADQAPGHHPWARCAACGRCNSPAPKAPRRDRGGDKERALSCRRAVVARRCGRNALRLASRQAEARADVERPPRRPCLVRSRPLATVVQNRGRRLAKSRRYRALCPHA